MILTIIAASHLIVFTAWLFAQRPRRHEQPVVDAIGRANMRDAIEYAKRVAFDTGAKYPSNVTTWPDRMERVEREVTTWLLRRGVKTKKRIVHWIVLTAVNAIGDN